MEFILKSNFKAYCMNFFRVLFLFFLIVPFIEIYLLLQIGGIVGVFPTILLVVFTAILGVALLRQQGFSTLQRFQDNLNQGQIPATEIVEGAVLLISGALLLTPGFFTDIIGFAGLIPVFRRKFALYIVEKKLIMPENPAGFSGQSQQKTNGNVLEGEYRKEK